MTRMTRNSIERAINAHIKAGATPEEAADAAITDATREELEALGYKWALRVAKFLSRRRALRAERATEARGATVAQAVATDEPRVRGLMFMVPGDGLVAWDEATAEQHLKRAAMQRRLAGECIQDAERHEGAAALIREHGVTCLKEIAAAGLSAEPIGNPRSRRISRKAA